MHIVAHRELPTAAVTDEQACRPARGWYLGARLFRDPGAPLAAALVVVRAQDEKGQPARDTEFEVAGSHARLGDMDRFGPQPQALRAQLATEPTGATR